ncbi:MAG TPA: hypothetical protein VGM51_07925 [Armatimonadota bacterium]|jgi:hypothetical protein
MTLYRVVSKAELDDISRCAAFRTLPGQMEGKWFAESLEDARIWGARLGIAETTIVCASVPDSMANSLFRLGLLDGIGPARFATEDDLPFLTPMV